MKTDPMKSNPSLMFHVLLATLLLLAGAGAHAATTLRILMLGNSYTDLDYAGYDDYEVWRQLQNFLNADPDFAATVSRRAPGAWTLYQHANDATSTNLVANQGPWDCVILQDQSYTPSHAWLYGGTWWDTFAGGIWPLTALAKSRGAKVIYYQTWARGAGETGVLATNYHGSPEFMQDNLTAAYGYAATYHGVKVAPVGEAWEKSLALSPALGLHWTDLSHMNPRGAYLAAATLYRTITRKDPSLLTYTSTLPLAEANQLRANLAALPAQPNLAIDPVIPGGQVFRISPHAASASTLGTVQATAYQPPPGAYVEDPHPHIVRYEITAGNTSGRFILNRTNGVLALAAQPVAGTNTLTIRVTDSNNWQTNNNIEVQVWENQAPVAEASASRLLYISPNGVDATAILDGSRSSDPEGDLLKYLWLSTLNSQPSTILATGLVAVVQLPVGINPVELVVNDGLATATNAITVEVITEVEAVERLIAQTQSEWRRSQPLLTTLYAALHSIQRGNSISAINQLQAFQNKLRAQVAPRDPALAASLTQAAQEIIDALSPANHNAGAWHERRFDSLAD
jgi:hypothetical protein